jgi:toxin secretion/phage lysis holin
MGKLTDSSALVAAKWVLAFLVSFWLSVPISVQILVTCMGLDFATGILVGFIRRDLSSHRSFVGIAKKVLILILVAVAHLISEALKLPFDLGVGVSAAYVVNEVISITENCANAGVPIPPLLLDFLLRTKKMTGRGEQAEVIEKLEAVSVSRPDGLGGVELISTSKKTIIGPKPDISSVHHKEG